MYFNSTHCSALTAPHQRRFELAAPHDRLIRCVHGKQQQQCYHRHKDFDKMPQHLVNSIYSRNWIKSKTVQIALLINKMSLNEEVNTNWIPCHFLYLVRLYRYTKNGI